MARKNRPDKSVLSAFQNHPLQTLASLRRATGLPTSEIKQELAKLISDKQVIPGPRGRYALASKCVEGEVDLKQTGLGFVITDQGQDIILRPPQTKGLLPGDRVMVVLKAGKNRRTGILFKIISRTKTVFTGTVVGPGLIKPDNPVLGSSLKLQSNTQRPAPGFRVSFTVSENNRASLVQVLGPADDPKTDTLVVMARFGLTRSFPEEMLAEANALRELDQQEISRRKDFTQELSITIDPRGSKDFDDAFSVMKKHDGWILRVHIADVSFYVKAGTHLDREARRRATSVYLLDTVVPMLPDRLSSCLSSLLPGRVRPVLSVSLFYGPKGQFKRASFDQAVIKTRARLTYQDAENLLKGESPQDPDTVLMAEREQVQRTLALARQLAEMTRQIRAKMGFIDLDLPEPEFVFDQAGRVIDVRPGHQGFSHKIIEEFMIAADRAVATEFKKHKVNGILRVHQKPDPEKLRQFARISAGGLGIRVPENPKPTDLAAVLEKARSTPLHQILSYHLLRSLKRAEYSVEDTGHFGLALSSYLHFTSPIRRYPDLVNHRILKALLRHEPPPLSKQELKDIASWCSKASRIADKAQWQLWDMKKIEFMQHKQGQVFEGVVSGVIASGLFVTVQKHLVEGFVRMPGCVFSPERGVLTCGKRSYSLGQKLMVKVVEVDRAKMSVELELVQNTHHNT